MSTAAAEETTPVPTPEASALLASLTSFLTITIHTLLHHRRLYPPETFLLARAYNLPVRQSRHPGVCAWVRDAVAAAGTQIRAGSARGVALVLHEPRGFAVVERWVFELRGFPKLPEEGSRRQRQGDQEEDAREDGVNWADVNEALRGALRRVAYLGESIPPPPGGCTFSLAVELRDEAQPPIQHPQLWIPSEPSLQPPTASNPDTGSALGGASTTPIRSVQAGPLFFECWFVQGKRTPEDHIRGTQHSDIYNKTPSS
ncbi:DNA polymerase zeta processivity subunit [Tolypocladium ophioglossoides CBS 100239]|uniref:DNA polymerase zeta processivity subunit n=1 Tax=Tolypocladium ophioglossoides (strain CBS 100239) TaxID=1163406 RepID=A0A0L0N806_TOLOC|nr:DNA polymerase zeta processivity subunit [Tolypocladium ophioglossoides CBS 100239]